MSIKLRFGPAGKPIKFKGKSENVPKFLAEIGLNAYEYQAVRGVRINEEKARLLGENAKEFDIKLTLHAPYYINLCSTDESILNASKKRLIDSLRAANWMNAKLVVFHPGYYGKLSSSEALDVCINVLKDVIEIAKSEDLLKNVYLSPETTGKVKQFGDLNEILSLCESLDYVVPTIDWAHIHARGQGIINSKDDYMKILDEIENRLGSKIVNQLHCHFTKVEFGSKGELTHHPLSSTEHGPEFKYLAEIIVENDYKFTIISESPILEEDALLMKSIVEELRRKLKS